MLANTLKTAAIAGLLGLGVAGTSGIGASAYTIKTGCDGDDCVRIQCNDDGYNCFRMGYFDRRQFERPYSFTRTYVYYPYDYDDSRHYTDYDIHFRNHFDPDNDYDEDDYPG